MTSLLYSGSLAGYRDIRFIFSHAGGTIPMLAGRLAELGLLSGVGKRVPDGVEYELKKLYYEIANSANRSTMAALTNLVPTSKNSVRERLSIRPYRDDRRRDDSSGASLLRISRPSDEIMPQRYYLD